MNHCQVQVPIENGVVFRGLDGFLHPETHYCKEDVKYVCDSGFKFCKAHKKSHGTRGKNGHIHTFKKIKNDGHKRTT